MELRFNQEDALIYKNLGSFVKFRVFLRGGKFCEVFRPQVQDIVYVRVQYPILDKLMAVCIGGLPLVVDQLVE